MTIKRSIVRALTLPAVLAGLTVTGCDLSKVLDVQPANLIPAVTLESPENAALLVAGVAADFDCAFNSFVVVGALIGEEFEDALQTAARWPYDQRSVTASQSFYSQGSCVGLGVYTPLQSARVAASNIRRLMEGWTDAQVPNRQLLIARAAAYEGWAQLLLSEAFCNNVFSSVNGEQIVWGTQISATQARDSAIARLTQAISIATTEGGVVGDSLRHFALVGRARAYHDADNMTLARVDAANVPADFVWNVTASSTTGRRNNRVYQQSNPDANQQSASVGTYYRTLNDPRVPVVDRARVSNGTNVPQWSQLKYTSTSSAIPAATGIEMQLLIAEADIGTANEATTTLPTIAQMRTDGNQPAYTGTTAAEHLAEIIDQRRRALFLTGTHWGDIIRYNITLSPAAGTTTPWGQTFGSSAGSAQCLPVPEVEFLNNPALQ